jgi:hypothetical protein
MQALGVRTKASTPEQLDQLAQVENPALGEVIGKAKSRAVTGAANRDVIDAIQYQPRHFKGRPQGTSRHPKTLFPARALAFAHVGDRSKRLLSTACSPLSSVSFKDWWTAAANYENNWLAKKAKAAAERRHDNLALRIGAVKNWAEA